MVRQGLVTRNRSKTSSREVVIALTAKGRAQADGLIPIAKKLEVTAVGGLSPKDLAVVKRALKRMYANLINGRSKAR
jgi:DNA-binding MarR family transcriptional regulator